MRGVTIMKKELLKGLTEEQIAKVKECKTLEEILALAKAEGIALGIYISLSRLRIITS